MAARGGGLSLILVNTDVTALEYGPAVFLNTETTVSVRQFRRGLRRPVSGLLSVSPLKAAGRSRA